jgi:O-antigen/teichoic acid export membrane protein
VVYSRLVVVGREGVGAATTLVKKYAVYLTGPLIAASVATFIAASLIPFVFGAKYGEAVYIARILCSIVVAWGFQNLAFDALNASEQHFVRLLVSIAAACLGCALIVVGTYLYGVNGTLGGVVAAEHVIAVALWIALIQLARRAR